MKYGVMTNFNSQAPASMHLRTQSLARSTQTPAVSTLSPPKPNAPAFSQKLKAKSARRPRRTE